MRYKRADIDSLSFSATNLEGIFIGHEDYTIQVVKSKSIFEPKEWKQAFGKPLSQHIIDARIVHTHLGLKLPLKTFSSSPHRQTVEFAGLKGYDERSELLVSTLKDLKSRLQQARVTRIDVCLDYEGGIPRKVISSLHKAREKKNKFRYGCTKYLKTPSEKKRKLKSNPRLDIKYYNKSLESGLEGNLMRLEFCFKSPYLGKVKLIDLEVVLQRIEKTIKRMAGITIKIKPFSDLKV